jgi:hypothetical protein
MPASSNPDQNSDAYGDRKSDEGAAFDFRGNPVQGIGANPAADLDCLIAETRRLLTCQASAHCGIVQLFRSKSERLRR